MHPAELSHGFPKLWPAEFRLPELQEPLPLPVPRSARSMQWPLPAESRPQGPLLLEKASRAR